MKISLAGSLSAPLSPSPAVLLENVLTTADYFSTPIACSILGFGGDVVFKATLTILTD
jgi:hypothetical protein